MTRGAAVIVAWGAALALIAGSTPRLVGDGAEYLAMSLNFAALKRPAIAPADLDTLHRKIVAVDPALDVWDIREASTPGRDGRRDFSHFWIYPLLAVPFLWATELLHATPIAAFTALNLALLGAALWVAAPRLGGAATLLLFGGPIIWWLDKPHTEPFTFALLVIALVLMPERPWWSMAAAGLASTQNLPIALLLVLVAAWTVWHSPDMRADRRVWIGLVSGLALAALAPAYTYARHGAITLLLRAGEKHAPTLAELIAVPLDPAIGLASNFPGLTVLVAAATVAVARRRPRDLAGSRIVLAAAAGAAFIAAFTQTTNVHHGATPGMSRYALWLVPLSIPLLQQAGRAAGPAWRRFAWSGAVASAATSAFLFHPRIPEYEGEPNWLASYLWRSHPGWNNPLPEVFSEIMSGAEHRFVPAATPNCEKLLLTGRGDRSAIPVPCFPFPLPPDCAEPGALCYANRDGSEYRFTHAPGSAVEPGSLVFQADAVWPAAGVSAVRTLLTQSRWWTLEPKSRGENILREVHGVRAVELEGPRRLVFVLRRSSSDPYLALRPPWTMDGVILDATSGETLRTVRFDGAPFSRWQVDLPAGRGLMLLSLWAS